ncbi:MAG TPA: hypothetical protein VG722_02620, partial [Tepidisphaeraceae bacterium]|nr:hypothetical protein [Tepidisphaeraceae bacterium]
PVEDTLSGHPGQTVVFTVKLTNLSPRLWDAGFLSSLYLNLGIPGTGIEDFPDLLAKVNIGKTLAPGASETVRLPVTIPDVPAGIHRYILDIQVHRAMTFSYYGSPTANVYLDVQR